MDKRDVHYFPVCSFCKFPHDRLEPCPVADKVIEELVHPPCPSCAEKDAVVERLEKAVEAARVYLLGSNHVCPDDCSSYNELSKATAALDALKEG